MPAQTFPEKGLKGDQSHDFYSMELYWDYYDSLWYGQHLLTNYYVVIRMLFVYCYVIFDCYNHSIDFDGFNLANLLALLAGKTVCCTLHDAQDDAKTFVFL